MNIIFKHILRNIAERKGRSLLIIISLLIASCVFILNLTIPNQIIEADKNKTRKLVGNADIMISSYGEKFDFKDLKLNDEKVNYVGVNNLYIIHKDKTVALYGIDMAKAKEFLLAESNNLNDDEIIINKNAADKFGYKVNDIITIDVNGQKFDLKIADILESKGLLYFKTYSGIMNNSTFNKINHVENGKYSTYFLDVAYNENIDSFAEYIKENNKDYVFEKLVDEKLIEENSSYISTILLIIFVMAVVMIYFVVNTLNKIIVMERTPVIATFRSVGATKHKMNGILILENAMYGLFGGTFGAGLALLINNLCVKLLLGGESLDTQIPFQNLIFGVAFAIILEIFMSISAIIKTNKYSIKELMFDGQSSKYILNKKGVIVSVALIVVSIVIDGFVSDNNIIIDLLNVIMFWLGVAYSIPLIMRVFSKIITRLARKTGSGSIIIASKNLGYNKMIMSSSRLVVISIAIMLVVFNVSATFDKILNSFSYQFAGYDVFIRNLSKEYTEYEDLKYVEGVEEVDFVYMISDSATYNNGKKFDSNPIILGMKESRPDVEEYNYKVKDLKENEILIDSEYAENNNLKIGDIIKIKFENFAGEHEFKIVGTVNAFYFSVQREIIVMNEKYFINNITKVPFQLIITAKENSDLKTIISRIENKLKDPDITIMTVDEFVEEQRSNISTIMYLFYIIIGLVVMLAFVGIINNLIISFMERTKELAVLNSVCMSRAQLRKMLIIENITSNLVACIVGFIVSIGSIKLINAVMNGIRMYIGVEFNCKLAVMFIGLVFAMLLATVVIPINKLRKINIVEAIKYE